MLTFPLSPLQMQCRLGWWLVCRLSTSLVPGVSQLGGRFLRSPFSQSESLFGQNQPPAIGVRSSLARVAWISTAHLLTEESSCTTLTFYQLIPPAPPTPPCHHGAVTTATRWTVSHRHTFHYMWLICVDVWSVWMYRLHCVYNLYICCIMQWDFISPFTCILDSMSWTNTNAHNLSHEVTRITLECKGLIPYSLSHTSPFVVHVWFNQMWGSNKLCCCCARCFLKMPRDMSAYYSVIQLN